MGYRVTYNDDIKEFKTKKQIAEHYQLSVYVVNKIVSLHNDVDFMKTIRKPQYIPRYNDAFDKMKIVFI